MGKKNDLVSVIRKARNVYRDTHNKIEAIKTIRTLRPELDLKQAKDFFDWLIVSTTWAATKLADQWCEEHWCEMFGEQHEPHTEYLNKGKAVEERKAANDAAKLKKIAAEEEHQPGKCPVLEAIFGRDWQRIVMEKVVTLEGQRWLNHKVEMWNDEQDRIAAYNYLNSMDSHALLHTEFPGVKK